MSPLSEAFLERLKQIIPDEQWQSILNSFERPKCVSFRVNPLKASSGRVLNELAGKGFLIRPVVWYDAAFILTRGTLRGLQETNAYQRGEIYLQELSSMIPVLVLDPQPEQTVLDLTAAPGSKTTQIAGLMQNTGTLMANDASRLRFFKLKANLESQGVRNTVLSQIPGENFGRHYPEYFDRVLLDAPCSGEGRFHLAEPESYQGWKTAKLKSLVPRQKMLFYAAFHALKPGGILVYSTCTFAPEENEGILDWAAEKFGSALEIQDIKPAISHTQRGLGSWKKKIYHPAVQKGLRVLPNEMMEGFFVAKMKKVA